MVYIIVSFLNLKLQGLAELKRRGWMFWCSLNKGFSLVLFMQVPRFGSRRIKDLLNFAVQQQQRVKCAADMVKNYELHFSENCLAFNPTPPLPVIV